MFFRMIDDKMENCIVCKKELKYRAYTVDGIYKDMCRKCQRDYRNTEPDKTMSKESRIKILLESRKSFFEKWNKAIKGGIKSN